MDNNFVVFFINSEGKKFFVRSQGAALLFSSEINYGMYRYEAEKIYKKLKILIPNYKIVLCELLFKNDNTYSINIIDCVNVQRSDIMYNIKRNLGLEEVIDNANEFES